MHAFVGKIQSDKILSDGAQMAIFSDFLRAAFSASRVQQISNQDSKFALRPHHVWKYGALSANLECMSEMCCTRLSENTGRKKSLKIAIWAPSHKFVGYNIRN